MISRYLVIGMAVAIAVLTIALGGMTRLYLGARDARIEAVSDRDSARRAASECSDSVDALMELAATRREESKAEVEAAAKRAQVAESTARRIQNAPQKVPGNVCASAQAEVDEELTERAP